MRKMQWERGERLDKTLTVTIAHRECVSHQCGCDAIEHEGGGCVGAGQQGSVSLISDVWGGDRYIHCAVTSDCEHLPLLQEMMKNDGF